MNKHILPRLIRQKDAPAYLSMSPQKFQQLVQPFVTVINNGSHRMVWYDRLELDAWADYFKEANGRPPKEKPTWQKPAQDCGNVVNIGTLKKPSPDSDFAKALAKRSSKQRKGISLSE